MLGVTFGEELIRRSSWHQAVILTASLLLLGSTEMRVRAQVLMDGSCPPVPVHKNFSPEKVNFKNDFWKRKTE